MPDQQEVHHMGGVVYVLPMHEGRPRWVRRFGKYAIGVSWRFSSFNIGVDVLKAGLLIAIGPFYVWAAHIKRQGKYFDQDGSLTEADCNDTVSRALLSKGEKGE